MNTVVLPSFDVPRENLERFLAAARRDAERSLADEPGCLVFDVFIERETAGSTAGSVKVMFYEVYEDDDAFERHLETPHLAAFRKALSLCREGPVGRFERVAP